MPASPIHGTVLRYPVRTLAGEELLPAGARVTPELLEEIAGRGRKAGEPSAPLMRHGTVFRDLLGFLCDGPYATVFGDELRLQSALRTMERVSLPRPLLLALDWFREEDPFTYRHVLCVFLLSSLIARDLVGDGGEAVRSSMAGPLHDFGKTCVPLPVMKKRTPLTVEEREQVRHHACAGFVLLAYHFGDRHAPAARVALEHHERRDGTGYPFGIRLEDRMVEIVAACDVYDALISPRPYRATCFDNRAALEEVTLLAEEGRLDRDVVRALVACNRRRPTDYRDCRLSLEKRGKAPEGNVYGITAGEPAPRPAPRPAPG